MYTNTTSTNPQTKAKQLIGRLAEGELYNENKNKETGVIASSFYRCNSETFHASIEALLEKRPETERGLKIAMEILDIYDEAYS